MLPKAVHELEFNHGSIYGEEEKEALLRVLSVSAPSCGVEVLEFEKEFAEFCGVKYASTVSSATAGLELAMIALEIKQGDEVIVPTISWISTATCAASRGATIKFADVDPKTGCIDPESISRLNSPKTKAVIVVHLYGRPCEMNQILEVCQKKQIPIVEDCAHAVGAEYKGKKIGTFGDISVFSFHQQKNMTTLGEGGMVVTNNEKLRNRIVSSRSLCCQSYDPKGKYLPIDQSLHPMGQRFWMMDFDEIGYNFRMTDTQAAVGRAQLKKVINWNTTRENISKRIYTGLKDVQGLEFPEFFKDDEKSVHSWHIFHILISPSFPLGKEKFMWEMLNTFKVKVWNHYSPMHLQSVFVKRGSKAGDCKNAEDFFERSVSLPLHPRLTNDAVDYLIESIRSISKYPQETSRNPLIPSLLSFSSSRGGDDSVTLEFEKFKEKVAASSMFAKSETIKIARSPGRLDLMGGNDDYSGGLVFEATISEATWVATQLKKDKTLTFSNPQMTDHGWNSNVEVSVDVLESVESVQSWVEKNEGCKWMFDVPLNKGVSSSASIEIATMKSAAETLGFSIFGKELATACQWAENIVCDSACGIMDQMAVTFGGKGLVLPMLCQPDITYPLVSLPEQLQLYAIDSGVSHQVSGIEYSAARAACFMGYKIICDSWDIPVTVDSQSPIPRYTDERLSGYLANLSPSLFRSKFEEKIPFEMKGKIFLDLHKNHVDPCTKIIEDYDYRVRANTKYAVEENQRVKEFVGLAKGCKGLNEEESIDAFQLMGELMYQSHFAYTECGLGSKETDLIVEIVRDLGNKSGLFGAKVTGGGAGGTVVVLGLKSAKDLFLKNVVEVYDKLKGGKHHVFEGSSIGCDGFGVKDFRF